MLLFESTFSFTQITYLMAYCIYTAASVTMQDIKTGDEGAQSKMQTFLKALQEGITTCPIVQRSLDIITDGLRGPLSAPSQSQPSGVLTGSLYQERNYLPAFPYPNMDTDHSMYTSHGAADTDNFPLLDCFPETLYDGLGSESDWFFPQA